MKTLATLIFVLFIGITAQAQEATPVVKVTTMEMGIVIEASKAEEMVEDTQEVARLYRRANAKVKKALTFTTKRNRAKLA